MGGWPGPPGSHPVAYSATDRGGHRPSFRPAGSPSEQAHVSAEQPPPRQDAWVPAADADACRPGDPGRSAAQGPRRAVGLKSVEGRAVGEEQAASTAGVHRRRAARPASGLRFRGGAPLLAAGAQHRNRAGRPGRDSRGGKRRRTEPGAPTAAAPVARPVVATARCQPTCSAGHAGLGQPYLRRAGGRSRRGAGTGGGVTVAPEPSTGVLAGLLVRVLGGYRRWVSPLMSPRCRFAPTCSEYAVTALRRHGAARGSLLAAGRVLRCQPFHSGGYDPVPPARTSPTSSPSGAARC